MTIFYSDKAAGLTPAATAAAGAPMGSVPAITPYSANEVVAVKAKATFTIAAAPATADTCVMCLLPAGCEPIDLHVETDQLDTSTGMTMTACVLDDTLAAAVSTTNFFTTESTAPRASGGGVIRANVISGLNLAASLLDRWIGIVFAAGATTPAAGSVRMVLSYRSAYVAGL